MEWCKYLRDNYALSLHTDISGCFCGCIYKMSLRQRGQGGSAVLEKYVIKGGKELSGEVFISGAKNAVAAILPCTILSDEPCIIENIPNISDVSITLQIMSEMGAKIRMLNKTTVEIDTRQLQNIPVPYEKAKLMRATTYFLGTLLGRFHSAHVSMPGGCNLGDRPIDQHLKCFSALGAEYEIDGGMVNLRADKLVGTQIFFDKNTVGATINAIMASVKADGLTIIENAAKEPHVVDLANCLNSMGADILGAGTDVIKIRGVKHHLQRYPRPDRGGYVHGDSCRSKKQYSY